MEGARTLVGHINLFLVLGILRLSIDRVDLHEHVYCHKYCYSSLNCRFSMMFFLFILHYVLGPKERYAFTVTNSVRRFKTGTNWDSIGL